MQTYLCFAGTGLDLQLSLYLFSSALIFTLMSGGTIYQACNFTYLGQTSGTDKQYLDPDHPEKGWFSGREFRKKSKYYRYAEAIGIDKQTWRGWMKKYSPDWTLVPPDIKVKI